jgi:hypothetical protein
MVCLSIQVTTGLAVREGIKLGHGRCASRSTGLNRHSPKRPTNPVAAKVE